MSIVERALGRDPYDALRGTRVPSFVRRSPRLRQAAIQARKRCPVDIGAALGVSPFVMAKSLACFATADARLAAAGPAPCSPPDALAELLARRLPEGGWGYEFDVQTRWAYYPSGTPNIIATAFAARALLTCGVVWDLTDARKSASAAARWIEANLLREGPAGPYCAYTPTAGVLVHNASLLGAATLAACGALDGDARLTGVAAEVARTSVRGQREDGGWPYGDAASLGWEDNFHTAYDLDALLLVWLATGDADLRHALDRGTAAWAGRFFGPNGEPHYLSRKAYPYDIHSAATAVDVAARLGAHGFDTLGLARRVAEWTRGHLIAPDSTTYYQRHRFWTDRRHFVRWGDAHWALATSSLALADADVPEPLESAVGTRA